MGRSSLPERPRVQLLAPETGAQIADEVRRDGVTRIHVEGFSGAGKSSFAGKLAFLLGWRHIDLDGLSSGVELESDYYADFLDLGNLARLLDENRAGVVIDGICLREVLERAGENVAAHVVYVARVSAPSNDMLMWHDGLDAEQPYGDLPWLSRAVIRYHRNFRPYADAQHILLRIAD